MVPVRARRGSALARAGLEVLPAIVTRAGEDTARRFLEFFTANIRNRNTRAAYGKAVGRFLTWCDEGGFELEDIEPMVVAAYIEQLTQEYSAPTVKQHLAAIRMLFDWMVTGGKLPMNPAASVRGPKHVVKTGKTPVLDADQARKLLDAIPLTTKDGSPCLVGLRDRALIGVMVFSFARVGAVVAMRCEDYFADGKRWAFRLHEKGGKLHKVPAHHLAEEYVDAYLEASGLRETPKAPLFQSVDRSRQLSGKQLHRVDVFRMIRRRAKQAGLNVAVCCHTFRATGITTYLENGGSIENAQAIANHESPRTTKLYDRTSDELTLDEVERIRI
ncbi:MAG: tyrosine-type recombinase/integrase [Candidatus Eisenbacteria bacterium]